VARFLVLLLASISLCGISRGKECRDHWNGGVVGTLVHPEDRPRFSVAIFRGDGNVLVGTGQYENYVKGNPNPPPAAIRGVKLSDGSFWPPASLQVGRSLDGPWRTIGGSSRHGKSDVRTVAAGKTVFLHVDLSAFIPLLEQERWGRVLLSTGDAAIIEFKDLCE
jgi:hypothetical protein